MHILNAIELYTFMLCVFYHKKKNTKIATTAHVETGSQKRGVGGRGDGSERALGARRHNWESSEPLRPGASGQAVTSLDWVTIWPMWASR